MRPEGYSYLPLGNRLDESGPDILTLRRKDGTTIVHFSVQGAPGEAIEKAAWEDYKEREERER